LTKTTESPSVNPGQFASKSETVKAQLKRGNVAEPKFPGNLSIMESRRPKRWQIND
jgi:hypothetical protein